MWALEGRCVHSCSANLLPNPDTKQCERKNELFTIHYLKKMNSKLAPPIVMGVLTPLLIAQDALQAPLLKPKGTKLFAKKNANQVASTLQETERAETVSHPVFLAPLLRPTAHLVLLASSNSIQ
jgi:hypothetical protein